MPNKSAPRAIASLLRLADADLDDARLLLQRGRTRGAAALIRGAGTRLLQAVQAAEQGRWDSASAQDLETANPFRSRLRSMLAGDADAGVERDGGLAVAPDRPDVQRALDEAAALLAELVALFSVTLQGNEPAGRTALVPPPPPEPAKPKPIAIRRRQAPPDAEPDPAPPSPPVVRPTISVAPPAASGSSASFWALMDRWEIADLDALGLLGHPGRLTKKGTRPRFRLGPEEAARLTRLRELDDALSVLDLRPAGWLREAIDAAPFRGATPLDLMRREPARGTDAVHRHVVRLGMRASLGGA